MQTSNPRVSVIVVNFNGGDYIETCLRSVLGQRYRDFELVLVDNHSSDGSVQEVRRKFPHMPIVENEQNLGYSGGINSGLRCARGEYIAPLNVDTEVEACWLERMVEFMDTHPDAGAATPRSVLYHDRGRIGVEGLNIHITGLGFVRGLNRELKEDPPQAPFQVAALSGCSYLIRAAILRRMGGLNEDNFMYYDDVDLSWMLNLMGYRVYCVPQSIVFHEYKLRMTPQKLYWLEYGRLCSLLSYLKPLTFLAVSPLLALTEAQIGLYCLLRGPSFMLAKIRAFEAVLRHLPRIRQRRRRAQMLRKLTDFEVMKSFTVSYDWVQVLGTLGPAKRVAGVSKSTRGGETVKT